MARSQTVRKWIVSPDGKVIVQAHSVASASGEQESVTHQDVAVNISIGSSYSRSSSFSSASSRK
jgi:hypothetical protein